MDNAPIDLVAYENADGSLVRPDASKAPSKPRKRKLTKDEQALMSEALRVADQLDELIKTLKLPSSHVDPRWLDIGANDIEKGMVSLKRSIDKPDTFA